MTSAAVQIIPGTSGGLISLDIAIRYSSSIPRIAATAVILANHKGPSQTTSSTNGKPTREDSERMARVLPFLYPRD